MSKCLLCKKKGLFLKLNKSGFCEECARKLFDRLEEEDAQRMDMSKWEDKLGVPVFEDGKFAIPKYVGKVPRWYSDIFSVKGTVGEHTFGYKLSPIHWGYHAPSTVLDAPWMQNPLLIREKSPDLSDIKVGDKVTFKNDDSNPAYDKSVAVFARNKMIGYINRTSLTYKFVYDYVCYKRPVWSYVSKINGDLIYIYVADYEPVRFEPVQK